MKFKVAAQKKGMTLLAFLREECPDAPSVKALKRAIEAKRCMINGRVETFSTHKLKAGDEISLELEEIKKAPKPLVLWEDESLIAFDKPAGVVCDPKNFKGHLVHRLDKETSGVLLVAKSKAILEQMIELFRLKQVHKTYLALVDGVVKEKKGTIISHLGPKHRFQGQTVYGSGSKGQLAETRWIKIGEGPKATLLECHPITGRTHQLRVHLKEAGHPIIGDYHYAKQFKCGYSAHRHLLHALEISFPHPVSKKQVMLKAPLPKDFSDALKSLLITHL
ncbi:MAG: RluA family pseudouridine synthase [Rhabdochlamydiaceae bacterium]|nr:RluA family pseudouridine synthase [Rhabdochlamydiaceae bacterium]